MTDEHDNPVQGLPADPVAAPSIAVATVKLPPYWPADPLLWFAQVEAQFTTRRITQQRTMYDYVVAHLAPEFAVEVRDLILTPPADNPYEALKRELVKRTAASEQRRLQQLFTGEELGDRKPSQLLRRMQQLLGDKKPDKSFLRELFLQRLPANVRMVLASTGDSSLDELANLADNIMEVAVPAISSVQTPHPHLTDQLSQLREEVSSLKQMVQSISRTHTLDRRRSRSRGRSPTPNSPRDSRPSTWCWYHSKFGSNARKCSPPCSFSSSGNGQASH